MFSDSRLLSPIRILKAIRWWLWYTAVCNGNLPFWKFVWYFNRPWASHRSGWY